MMSQPDKAVPPLFDIDDDDLLGVYMGIQELRDSIEPRYADETVLIFDANLNRLSIDIDIDDEDAFEISVHDGSNSIEEVWEGAERFFRVWTNAQPPERTREGRVYSADLLHRYRSARVRRRKRR